MKLEAKRRLHMTEALEQHGQGTFFSKTSFSTKYLN
jgi:hypothetical protein